MSFIAIVMIIMSGCHLKYLFTLFAGSIGAGLLGLIMFKDKLTGGFRSDRIAAWLDPFADPSGTSYQTIQGLYAIGSGGLFGVGLGQSKQKYLYIPEAHNDFIFAILAEELGFVGCAIVLILFAKISHNHH
jgi:cell division protein FtsW